MSSALNTIINEVCEQYVLRYEDLLDRQRTPIKVSARTTAAIIALQKEFTLEQVGTALGNMHHSSVMYLRDHASERFYSFKHHRPAHVRALKTFGLL